MRRSDDLVSFIRSKGVWRFCQECLYRAVNAYHERRLGVQTTRTIRLADLGISHQESIDSTPLGYRAFYSTLKTLPLEPKESVFLDFGMGKGRAVCAASSLPFKRVVGVDFSDVLVAKAEENVRRLKRRKAEDVQILLKDATAFEIPADVNLIYFYNPFFGETLRRVVSNIRVSWERHPRKIYVMFFNDDHFAEAVDGQRWIRKTHQARFYPGISCGVYETT